MTSWRSLLSLAYWRERATPVEDAHRYGALDGIRGVAVGLVLLVHLDAAVAVPLRGTPTADLLHWLGLYGNYGVDLFFVLSGWLLYGGLVRRPQGYAAFLGRRIRRIYPTFLAVLLVYLVLSVVAPGSSKLPETAGGLYILENILLLPGVLPIRPIIAVAWSLSYEMLFYLTVPLLAWAARRSGLSPVARVMVWAALGILAAVTPAACAGGRYVMFAVGMALVDIGEVPGLARRLVPVALGTVGLACLLVLADGVQVMRTGAPPAGPVGLTANCDLRLAFTCAAIGGVVLLALHHEGIGGVLRRPRLRWLGNISYSYYLAHGLAIHAVMRLAGTGWPQAPHAQGIGWGLVALAIPTTVLLSLLLYGLVEFPLSIDLLRPGGTPAAAAAPSGPLAH